jgi:hypothetical protein
MRDCAGDAVLYTFFIERAGATIIEQLTGVDLLDCVRLWYTESETQPGRPTEELEASPPTPLQGVENAWCFSGVDPEDRFYLVHVVATAGGEAASGTMT